MKNKYAIYKWQIITALIFAIFSVETYAQQVTGIYTDYLGYWHSTNSNQNPVEPENSHNVIGFTHNGTTYSTGVNDMILTNHSVTYSAQNFRALPILDLPTGTQTYYLLGFGQLYDGIDNGADTSSSSPFQANPTGSELASYLTRGPRGLDLGTYITNIPNNNKSRFELSSQGLDLANIGDNVPDIFVSQIAQPGNNDELYFVDNTNTQVGDKITVSFSSITRVGIWRSDLYDFNSQPSSQINIPKDMRFVSYELSEFNIAPSDVNNVVALIYKTGGNSDPAFIAYNEPSIPVASRIDITSQPTTSSCDGTMPSSFTIQITDADGFSVAQAGFEVTASIKTGPGDLFGTITQTTDASGQATFNDLVFEVGGDHTIAFNTSSLEEVVSTTVADATGCGDATWTGNVDTDWNDVGNWSNAEVPNANFNVTIPTGLTNYPVLDINTGADNLIMEDGATIDLNGYLFTIQETITAGTGAYIDGSAADSELHFSGQAAQSIPNAFISGDLANLTIENPNGVSVNTPITITEVLNVISGQLTTNGNITLTCDFSGNTAQIDEVTGSINGAITTEQCFPARRAFRFVTSSVTTTTSIRENWQEDASSYTDNPHPGYGTHITGVGQNADGDNGFDYTPSGNSSMYELDNINQSWFNIDNTDATTLVAGKPYRLMIRGDRSIDVTDNDTDSTDTRLRAVGEINVGPISYSSGFSDVEDHFNFFGNPYHAIVDMSQVLANVSTSNVNTLYYYIWDPTVGTRGSYSTIDVLTNTGTNGDGDKFIMPMKAGFFLTGDQGTTPTLAFTEANKNVNQTTTSVFRPANSGNESFLQLNIYQENLFNAGEQSSDGLKIKFQEYGDDAFTYKDAPKMFNLDENLARNINGDITSIEVRSYPEISEVLPLYISTYRTTNYIFEAQLEGLEEYDVYLKDNYLNQNTLLTNGGTYSFQVNFNQSGDATINSDRFELMMAANNLSVDEDLAQAFQLFPNPTSSILNIKWNSTETIASILIYDNLGRTVKEIEATENFNHQINLAELNTGLYVIQVNTINGKTFTQKIVKE